VRRISRPAFGQDRARGDPTGGPSITSTMQQEPSSVAMLRRPRDFHQVVALYLMTEP